MALNEHATPWIKIYAALFVAAFVVIFIRLVQIQVFENEKYTRIAKVQHQTEQVLPAPRGKIYDRNMRPLADTLPTESVWLYKPNLSGCTPEEAAKRISEITGVSASDLYRKLTSTAKYVKLISHVNNETANKLCESGIKGLEFQPDTLRYYPNSHAASQLLGFCNFERVGAEGLERQFDKYLKGQDGYKITFRDALGRQIASPTESLVEPRNGYDVVLTLDLWAQTVLEEAIGKMCEKYKPKNAIGVVMDVRTGELLAMTSWPFYDPNYYSKYPAETYRNRPVTDIYEPGSMLKSFTAAAAFENDVVTPDTVINCENGRYYLHGRVITDAGDHHYGDLTFTDIIAKSSNIGTSKVAEMVGAQKLYDTLVSFGFNSKTNAGLWGEEKPWLYPTSKWSKKSLASISFGYEISVTPLSLIRAYGAIAADGTLPQLSVIKGVYDNENHLLPEYERAPYQRPRVVSQDTVQKLRKILREVVLTGTCKTANIKEYEIAGKTGTAHKVINGRYDTTKTLSSFIGFAPLDNPRILVLVSLDEPKMAHYGGTVAGPAVAETIRRTLQYLGVAPKTD